MHFWSQLWPGGHFDGCSASLKCKSESLTRKLQIWTRILTNHSFFIGNFKIAMIIYENQLFSERTSKIWTRVQKIIGFSKENWHRGGTEKIEKSAGRAASAIGVLRIFASGVFAWRFFRFFWDSYERNDRFLIDNWKIKEAEKAAGRAASAIGVLRNFKSSVFAWRFFDLFGTAPNGMQVLRTKMT